MRSYSPPFIGIKGFMHRNEVQAVLDSFPLGTGYVLMSGVLVNNVTLFDHKSRWPGRYPKIDDVKNIFIAHPLALNLINYSAENIMNLHVQLNALAILGGQNFDGFLLNIDWPPIGDMEIYWETNMGNKKLVLQINCKAMEKLGYDPEKIAERVGHYLPMIDYVLVDTCTGVKQSLESFSVLPILEAIRDQDYPIKLGISGDFGPGNMKQLEPVAVEIPDLSIVAGESLRTPPPKDTLDIIAMKQFIKESFEILAPRRI